MRKTALFALMLAALGSLWAQSIFDDPPRPLLASLEFRGSMYQRTGSITLQVAGACTVSNPATTHYQYKRVPVAPATLPAESTAFLLSNRYTFTGAANCEQYKYFVRAAFEADTSEWSDSLLVTHDTEKPAVVSYLAAQYCGLDALHPFVQLTWEKVENDCASPNVLYRIYRNPGIGDIPVNLTAITESTPAIAEVPYLSNPMNYWNDTEVEYGRTYQYTVVTVDTTGQFPMYSNPIATVRTLGIGLCPTGSIMTIALNRVPTIFDYTQSRVELNREANWFAPYIFYQYALVRATEPFDTIFTTAATNTPYYTFSGFENCDRWCFLARAINTDTHDTSNWDNAGTMLIDNLGPEPNCDVDSIYARAEDSWIYVNIRLHDEAMLDCGVGVRDYRLYRIENTPEGRAELFPFDTTRAEHLRLCTYTIPEEGYRDRVLFEYWDDESSHDPVIDLRDGVEYKYYLVMFDKLGYATIRGCMSATATADLGVVNPILRALPSWTNGTELEVQIIDTSRGDIDSLHLEWAYDPAFSSIIGVTAPIALSAPAFTYVSSPTSTWDTLSYTISDLRDGGVFDVCVRAISYDRMGNISDPSNVVCTRFDNQMPNPAYVNTIFTRADSTFRPRIVVRWNPTTDAGVGMREYKLYRSDALGTLGELVATIAHSPFTTVYQYIDRNANSDDNYRANYYSVVSVDLFGQENATGFQRGFDPGTPPYTVTVDSAKTQVFGGEMYITLWWTDNTPSDFGSGGDENMYRLEHSSSEALLLSGDVLLINTEEPTYSRSISLPRSVMIGSPHRYFRVATIDARGNESGYSLPLHFYDDAWSADSFTMHLYRGWNMISLPLLTPSRYYRDIFTTVISSWTWNADVDASSWLSGDTMNIGHGYMVFSSGEVDVPVRGFKVPMFERDMTNMGFYMIGTITDPSACNINPSVYLSYGPRWWNPITDVYELHDTLMPGKGYWIAINGPVTLALNKKSTPAWSAEIEIGGQVLYFGEGNDEHDLLMPPPPPEKQIPQFISDSRAYHADFRTDGHWTIDVPCKTEAQWNSADLPRGAKLICGGREYDMHATNRAFLDASSATIEVAPCPNAVAVNAYPNPFNASADIQFTAVEDGLVACDVYSIDGKHIKTLSDKSVTAGVHTVKWNGTDDNDNTVPGGVYLITVRQASESATTKILFVK